MHSFSFISFVNRPTRITENSATLIDNIFINHSDNLDNSFQCIIYTDVSDHFPVIHIDTAMKLIKTKMPSSRRNMSFRNKQAFCLAISETDWGEIYNTTDTQEAFTKFHSVLTTVYTKHFPKITVLSKYNNHKPWLTQGLKNSIKIKNKLYVRYIKRNTAQNEMQYKYYRNKLNHILKIAEQKHYTDLLNNNKSNLKKTWKIMKGIINKNRSNSVNARFKLQDGTLTTDKQLISERFNEFFVGIGPSLAKKIPPQNVSVSKFMGAKELHSIYLSTVSPSEMNKIISSLKNGAPGHDEISSGILRLIFSHINEPIAYLCNLSFINGIFPNYLKLTNVLPLYKADDQCLFNNYRPVSLLCVLSKVFETVMYNRLIDFLESRKTLVKEQLGFRKLHSSYMALMLLMDKLIKSLENGEFVIGIFLDFSKALDTVDHAILSEKLYHYGIRGTTLDWFNSYLFSRKQYVTYNGISSHTKTVSCGVPQRSILGPLLFLIYINDLSNVCKYSTPILYADDTNRFLNGMDLNEMENAINTDLKQVSLWLKVNKLSLNVKKTHFIVFTNKRKTCH